MINKYVFVLLLLLCAFHITAQESGNFKPYMNEAGLIKKGDVRYSLFTNAEYGLSDKVSVCFHPVWIFMAPAVAIKWNFMKSDQWALSTLHGISIPTPAMRLFSASGTGGLISPEFDIPWMFSIRNGIIATKVLKDKHHFSGQFVVEFALNNSKLEPGSSIDIPVISPRNAVYYKNVGFDFAVAADGKIYRRFDYFSKMQLFLFPFEDKEFTEEYRNTCKYFTEWTTMVFYNTGSSFKIGVGSRLSYGDYPFGSQWHLLPHFDFVKYIR